MAVSDGVTTGVLEVGAAADDSADGVGLLVAESVADDGNSVSVGSTRLVDSEAAGADDAA